ncbi:MULTISPECIES: Fe(3+) ABC transporter substrate-binding protein [unclassified Thioalkalivibrio]|uniref:Fe(3+) ABC transporter substrate-binding protein n=1 Tax=unclassified Thioalkalivibrio TaxID=2621013 RepID=UPI000375C2FB|nr:MULTISPECIES: Fe(3+) ABC transporter substrate-binding protein [unclassified Thioalkalivibrio]
MRTRPLNWIIGAAATVAITLPLAGCGPDADNGAADAGEVNLYSARQEQLIQPLLERFTDETGIEVNLVTGGADALLQRLRQEGRNSPADVFITVDAGRLHQAHSAGVLQGIESTTLENNVPERYRDPDGEWFGLSMRARPIMYHTDRVDPSELSTYEALTDEQWEGRICIRSSDNIYNQSLVASMLATEGEDAAQQWVNGIVANMARRPQGGDRDQIRAVADGVCDIAIANTYYLGIMLEGEGRDREVAEQIGVFWPNQNDRGTHVNISGAGVTAHAPNQENAARLIEYLTSESAQEWYAEANQEYPIRDDVPASDILAGFGDFVSDDIDLYLLGENNAEAVRILDRGGWR